MRPFFHWVASQEKAGLPIRQWIQEEQPRSLLQSVGAEALTPAKLLAIILRTGTPGVSAEELSRRLLNRYKGLRGMDTASIEELCAFVGIGRAKASQLKAAFEIGKRLCRERARMREHIETARQAAEYAASYYGPSLRDARHEALCAIFLDGGGTPLRTVELCRGGSHSVAADPHQIVRQAIMLRALSVILVHNHPCGRSEPSADDISFTDAVNDACTLFGIRLLDHLIIGRNKKNQFSFAKAGLIYIAPRSSPE